MHLIKPLDCKVPIDERTALLEEWLIYQHRTRQTVQHGQNLLVLCAAHSFSSRPGLRIFLLAATQVESIRQEFLEAVPRRVTKGVARGFGKPGGQILQFSLEDHVGLQDLLLVFY